MKITAVYFRDRVAPPGLGMNAAESYLTIAQGYAFEVEGGLVRIRREGKQPRLVPMSNVKWMDEEQLAPKGGK
ncbi:hypothetical protein AKJ09_03676 [Labilithrix luteola]|uniref:Uncharacterized protein n=1 Tax=Labilithrix luteola TaxID=1391654 RepID=A0A0K1PU17_9BACT|nr:hypothetical protein [Labilithrix luteola]AKU97012.1 hypothetical protein AKJ09_03676 [Labilithrix luteola]